MRQGISDQFIVAGTHSCAMKTRRRQAIFARCAKRLPGRRRFRQHQATMSGAVTRQALLLALSTCATMPGVAASLKPAAHPPNFIVILADDLGYGDLGCYGSQTIRTPRLDRMAAEGVRFTDFHVTSSICSPSRASLLTGRYAQRAGLPFVLFPTERKGLAPDEITLAELLKARGYATACIGKWHLGFLPPFRPARQGFDYFFGLPYSNDSAKQPPDRPFDPVLAPVELPLLRGDEIIEAPVNQATLTESYTEEAVRFIRANRDRPFFLYLPHTFPHKPLHASGKFRGQSSGGLYGDTVECLDWSAGQILDALQETGLDERTLVFFTSDNGPAPPGKTPDQGGGSAGPLRGLKFTAYEGGFRVPAICRWPGRIPPGRVRAELVTALDLFPTFAKLAKATLPKDRVMDGADIWPMLSGKRGVRSPHDLFGYYLDYQLQAVRSGRWKLFIEQSEYPALTTIMYTSRPQVMQRHFPLRDQPSLYDLESDLGETRDLGAEHPEVVKRLSKLARDFDRRLQADKRPECVVAE
jgi:arylsulfatase A-like enzyme